MSCTHWLHMNRPTPPLLSLWLTCIRHHRQTDNPCISSRLDTGDMEEALKQMVIDEILRCKLIDEKSLSRDVVQVSLGCPNARMRM